MWYQALLTAAPDLAGAIAIHHGSIEQELRLWVEDALHTEKLKAVICLQYGREMIIYHQMPKEVIMKP